MARESELDELRMEIDDLKRKYPISDLANSMASVESEVTSSVEAVAPAAETVEPRSGEFAVTDSAPHAAPASSNAPVVEAP
jgi:hypothetical protein